MDREEVIKWLKIMKANLNSFPEVSNAKKIEALAEAIRLLKNERSIDKIDCDNADCNNCVNHKYCDYESNKSEIPTGSATKNDLGVREFEEIVVEYPPEDLCTYPEYKGKPYFSIKYKEGNDCFIGYGTYSPKVFSRFLRDYFMPSVTPQEPITNFNIPFLMHKEMDIPISECQKAYDVAIEYLRSQGKLKG